MKIRLGMILLMVAAMACSSKKGAGSDKDTKSAASTGHKTPEDVAKAMVANPSYAAWKALLAPKAVVASLMNCKDPKDNSIARRVTNATQRFDKRIAKKKTVFKPGVTAKYVRTDTKSTRAFKKGDKISSCTILKGYEAAKIKLHMTLTKDGKSEEEKEGMRVVKLDGNWYLMSP